MIFLSAIILTWRLNRPPLLSISPALLEALSKWWPCHSRERNVRVVPALTNGSAVEVRAREYESRESNSSSAYCLMMQLLNTGCQQFKVQVNGRIPSRDLSLRKLAFVFWA
jgi:hypothetical protein